MSFSPLTARSSLRSNEILLSARQFFTLRDTLDNYHEAFRSSNLASFPSFGATFLVSGGSLVLRSSGLNSSTSPSALREFSDAFYAASTSSIDDRISRFVEPSAPFGKMSSSLHLDLFADPKSGNLPLFATIFPQKDLDNPIVRGISIAPHPSLDEISNHAHLVSSNLQVLLDSDVVSKLRYLIVALEMATKGLGSDKNLTVPSDLNGSPVQMKAGEIVSAISQISQVIRATEAYILLDALICQK